MIMEVLGVLIAFVTSMLLFSLLVTAFVQFLQSSVKLRVTNLYVGVELLKRSSKDEHPELEHLIDRAIKPLATLDLGRFRNLWISTQRLDRDDLRSVIESTQEYEDDRKLQLIDYVDRTLPRVEDFMSQRFKKMMDILSFATAMVIVCIFQLHTPELFKRLTYDLEYRNLLIQAGEELVTGPPISATSVAPQTTKVLEQIILDLTEGFPEYATQLESLSGEALTLSDELQELSMVSRSLSFETQLAMKERYLALRASKQEGNHNSDRLALLAAFKSVDLYRFELMPHGWSFFLPLSEGSSCQPNCLAQTLYNWLGLLISAILISLGAPFWFEVLKKLFTVRQQLLARPK